MSVPADWLEFRRSDRELVGWLRPDGEGWMPVDLLGRDAAPAALDLDRAEGVLDELGIGFLAERWSLERDGVAVPVRLSEVSVDAIVVVDDAYGSAAVVAPGRRRATWTLPWPAPATLRRR
ncbi:hypothetical protein GCM10022288_06600 [Gryllotalpicola kribbensis]|jgi:hypothetical protein|uniref:Uncharacterized protein n=1 Tax=Gryllotalpicola kribbensis TaxID=993084 RepID=A0ABP8AJU6_9MICO